MTWTTKKLISTALFAGLFVVILYLSSVVNVVLGSGAGPLTIAIPLFAFIMLIVYKRMISDFGSITLLMLIGALLSLPIPVSGPAGFLPKIVVYIAAGIITDFVFVAVKKFYNLGNVIIGISMAVSYELCLFLVFIALGVPGTEKFVSLFYVLLPVIAIEGIIGGFLGGLIYRKIKNRVIVKRLLS